MPTIVLTRLIKLVVFKLTVLTVVAATLALRLYKHYICMRHCYSVHTCQLHDLVVTSCDNLTLGNIVAQCVQFHTGKCCIPACATLHTE